MKRSLIGITLAMVALVAVITGAVRADPLTNEVLKFYQTPLNNGLVLMPPGGTLSSNSVPAQWPGHDELSTAYLTNGNFYVGTYMADDFCDFRSTPIVHVMWWGSYINNYRGSNGVQRFLITFETDVAANATNNPFGFSHPGTNIVSQIVTLGALAPGSGTYMETLEPIGPGQPSPDGNLYQYNAELAIPVPETSNRVEWIKIVALTSDPQLMWGWHNRDYGVQDPLACIAPAVTPGEFNQNPTGQPIWHFQDDAVTGGIVISQGTNVFQSSYAPTFYQPPYDGIPYSKDLAFALYTEQPTQTIPCETIKFYQVPLNNGAPVIPNGGTISQGSVPTPFPGHDELSTAYYNVDGNFYTGTYMADDFCDLLSTPIVHVTWWGSYMSNYFGSVVQQFLITFETDVASNAPGNTFGFSHPGSNIVSQIVTRGLLGPGSGTFAETLVPIGPIGPINPDGNLFQYDAELAIPVPETSNQVEWIKIVALTTDQQLRWGWHNRDYGIRDPLACTAPSIVPGEFNANPTGPPLWHFQDDAVTGGIFVFPGTNVQQTTYAPTFYIPQYDGINSSKDLAFALYTLTPVLTFNQWQLKYFGCTLCPQAAALADPDGDGMNNTNEFLADTIPTSSASLLRVLSIARQGPGSNDVKITWSARSCKTYVVQVFPGNPPDGSYSNNFVDIGASLVTEPSGGGDLTVNYVDVGGATNKPSRYYRVRLVP
jgi:hypothetical protein